MNVDLLKMTALADSIYSTKLSGLHSSEQFLVIEMLKAKWAETQIRQHCIAAVARVEPALIDEITEKVTEKLGDKREPRF